MVRLLIVLTLSLTLWYVEHVTYISLVYNVRVCATIT